MNRLSPEAIVKLTPQLDHMREIDQTMNDVDSKMRRIVKQEPDRIQVEHIQSHIETMRNFFARTERSYQLLVETKFDDPVTAGFIQIFSNRISKKNEFLEYWQGVVNSKLS